MVVDWNLPPGIIADTAAVMGITLGKQMPEFSDLTMADFPDLAQGYKTYDEFIEKMKGVSETELNYFGIAICGAKKKVNKLTGSIALLR